MADRSLSRLLGGVLFMSLALGNIVPLVPAMAQSEAAEKVVVAHRGASGYLPEHTLAAAAMAYAQGAHFQEQDVVMTRDDQLIVWHDLTLDRTTDVRQRFPGRARADGRHYVIDFTLEEIRQLQVTEGYRLDEQGNERMVYADRFPLWRSSFRVNTLAEQIELVQGLNHATGRDVGIYPELKAPAFHHQHGKDIGMAVLAELKRYGYTSKDSNVFVQTFEFDELKRVKEVVQPALGIELKLVQLMGDDEEYQWMLSPEGMRELARFADGIGPEKGMIISSDSERNRLLISSLVRDAHQAGLKVHPYTFRADQGQVPAYASSFEHMLELFLFEANVDGLFTDFPDRAVNFLRDR
jgi:glycerophosphoryl diester phosphodiesterase